MLNKSEAHQIAEKRLLSIIEESGIDLLFLDDVTLPFEFGWVFFYQSKEYVKTLDLSKLVGGNAPILVDKYTGQSKLLGTALSVEEYLEEYCSNRSPI